MNTTVDLSIKMFANFLNSSWDIAFQILQKDYLMNDWLQANWELLVEQQILKPNDYLEVYGEGADLIGTSSRITIPEALSNYKIEVKPKNKNYVFDILNNEKTPLENVCFDKFVGFENNFYVLKPDFKYALIMDKNIHLERVVSIDELDFCIVKL